MNRQEYLDEIKDKLLGLSEEDIDKALDFYMEAIDDRMEDGLTEDQAVAAVGSPDEVAEEILMETPLPKLVSAKVKPKRSLKVWEIVLIVLGFPVWFPLLLALGSVALALVITALSLVFSLIVVDIAWGIGGIIAFFAGVVGLFVGEGAAALLQIGLSLVLMALSIVLFIPCKAVMLWGLELLSRFVKWLKKKFIRKTANK
ncbi:MAG: DUF1700 domain-containing protein [Clostridiales bacterium]|nr:DUF1700 domain-containing protein [Clostridiales bacterium]